MASPWMNQWSGTTELSLQTPQVRGGVAEHTLQTSPPQGGAAEHAQPPLKRIAPDGSNYTETYFAEWYGPQYGDWWELAVPSDQGGAAEHSLQSPPVQEGAAEQLQSTLGHL